MKKVMNECMTYEVGFNIMDVLVWGCLSACFFFSLLVFSLICHTSYIPKLSITKSYCIFN